MEIMRFWDMPNKKTFEILAIKAILKDFVGNGTGWIDPFARNSKVAEHTNDLNKDTTAQYNLEAVEFLKMFDDLSMKGILIDPPYSNHQATHTYEGYGTKRIRKITPIYDNAKRILKVGGLAIKFGWSSCGLGEKRGFKLENIFLIAHGGEHNDTIITVERKIVHQNDLGL